MDVPQRQHSMHESARKLLEKVDTDKLPSLPHVLLKFLEACHRDTFSFDELSQIINKDTSLCARVISVANSAAYGRRRNLDSLERVLILLGVNAIKTIAITSSVQQFFSRFSTRRTRFLKNFWHHALTSATISRSLASLSSYKYPDEAYLTGLLHDLGMLVLDTSFPDRYVTLYDECSSDEELETRELKTFGTTHYAVGAGLIASWDMHSFIADAVLYHHESIDNIQDAHHLVRITRLANALCPGPGQSMNSTAEPDAQTLEIADQLFGLTRAMVVELAARARQEVQQVASSMDIEIDADEGNENAQRETQANDQLKQVQLAEQVRNISLMSGLRQQVSSMMNENELIDAVEKNLTILFGISHSLVFLVDDSGESISGKSVSESRFKGVCDISIPMEINHSLVTDCLVKNEIISSPDADQAVGLKVIDRQLVTLTEKAEILCLPMISHGHPVGVLVLATDASGIERLLNRKKLLQMFSNEMADTFNKTIRQDTTSPEMQLLQDRAREIGHETSNPLHIMNNYLEILSAKLDINDPARDDLEIIKDEIDRVGHILLRLSDLGQTEEASQQLVHINTELGDILSVFETSLFNTHKIQATIELDEHLPAIASNRNALRQIFTNLLKNAVEAVAENGEIFVYTHDQINVDGEEFVEIRISDNGPGISAEILPGLFHPVESTKDGNHAGLGLAIVKNLINEINGSISCRSNASGTSFQILLPREQRVKKKNKKD